MALTNIIEGSNIGRNMGWSLTNPRERDWLAIPHQLSP